MKRNEIASQDSRLFAKGEFGPASDLTVSTFARHPDLLSKVFALEIMVAPRLQRRGISRLMLAAMRGNARRLGFVDPYAPLRPTGKHLEPLTPFADYVARRREDGLPYPTLKHTKTSNQCGTPHKAFLRCCRPSRPLR